MKKKQRIILLLLGIVIITGSLVYNYVFNAEHRNISNEKATVTISAKKIYSQFETNEALATTNYLDQVIEVKGTITEIEDKSVVLDNYIQVNFSANQIMKFNVGELLVIKGRCVGYDELLEMVKIDQATVIN